MDGCKLLITVLIFVQYGSNDPTPLEVLTINLNLDDSREDKKIRGHEILEEDQEIKTSEFETFEEDLDLKAGQTNEVRAVVIGGVDDKKASHNDVEVYINGKWEYLELPMVQSRHSMGVTNLDNKLYVAGGKEFSDPEATSNPPKKQILERENDGEWSFHTLLNIPRFWNTLSTVRVTNPDIKIREPTMMVTGGLGVTNAIVKRTEIFHPKKGWLTNKDWSMAEKRYGHAAVVLNDELFVFGGHGEEKIKKRKTEIFNFERMEWREGPELRNPRIFHAATMLLDANMGETIITCGGYSWIGMAEHQRIYWKTCEKGNDKGFNVIEDMNVKRAGFGMVTIGEEVWAIGGFNGLNEALDSVEKYKRGKWTQDKAKLKSPRKHCGAATIIIDDSNERRLESAVKNNSTA